MLNLVQGLTAESPPITYPGVLVWEIRHSVDDSTRDGRKTTRLNDSEPQKRIIYVLDNQPDVVADHPISFTPTGATISP